MKKISVAGLELDAITKSELLPAVEQRLQGGQKTFITTPYSEFLYEALINPKILEVLNRADFAVADGIGILWAAKYLSIPLSTRSYYFKIIQAIWQEKYSLASILFKPGYIRRPISEKIPGSELIWDLSSLAAKMSQSIYLLGGFGQTPEIVAQKLVAKFPNLKIAGTSSKNPDDESIIADLQRAKPDLLFVAFGPIKQEHWIVKHYGSLPVKLAIGLGGTFDYLSGRKANPPKWMRKIGLEWLFRLLTQPKRIGRIKNATFGLMLSLLRYKVFTSLPFRDNVACVIINKEKKILICRRKFETSDDKWFGITQGDVENHWQFPQGGIESSEDVETAARREAGEETGLHNLEVIKISKLEYTYDWPSARRPLLFNDRRFRGQRQRIIYLRFTGPDSELKLDNHEFSDCKWVDLANLETSVHPIRRPLVKLIIQDYPLL